MKIKLPKTKLVPFGPEANQKWNVRVMGNKVRLQDMETGSLYLLPPVLARLLADALKYAAHHAEVHEVPKEQEPLFADAKITNVKI